MIRTMILALAVFTGGTVVAVAGEQYVDSSGYAVSGYDVVAYFDLEPSPLGSPQPDAVRGNAKFTTEYNDAKWAFSSAENLASFKADPMKYVPQYDGHCSFGVAGGYKVPANPHLWRISDGKLYLNITKGVARRWEKDIPGYITKSDGNWRQIEPTAAADNEVPSFDGPLGPVTN